MRLFLLFLVSCKVFGCLDLLTKNVHVGNAFKFVIVITHATRNNHPDKTKNNLEVLKQWMSEHPNLKDKPIISMVWPESKGVDTVFRQLTMERHPEFKDRMMEVNSLWSEIPADKKIISEVYWLGGGNCGACLSQTFHDLITEFERSELKTGHFIVALDAIYGKALYENPANPVQSIIKALLGNREFKKMYGETSYRFSPKSILFEIAPSVGSKKKIILEVLP